MWSVLFVFLSYLDRNLVKGGFLDAKKESKDMLYGALNGTFCAKMSLAAGENVLYQVTDGVEAVRSVVSPAGKLLDCSVIANQAQVKALLLECLLVGVREGLEARFARMDEAKLGCREFQEKAERSAGAQEERDGSSARREKVSKRSKRGFTYPGTLWCGAGNMADDYNQLGEYAETDSCCRTHDHCPHVIHAFSSKYGYTNFKWHSICHCDCDEALKACLRSVNDTSSRIMGQAFFNVIGVPCFEFAYEEQCVERHWYGVCKRSEKLPIAVLKEAVPYDFGGIDVIDVLTRAPPKMKDTEKHKEEPEPEPEPESATQSAAPGLEEPSLGNVVTAAEDFIKVLATVSTSQGSANDSDKAESQSSEKKRRKNLEKKKKKKDGRKRKGKGRKRKQKAAAATAAPGKTEEGATVPSPGRRAEEVTALSNFISESYKHKESSRVAGEDYELRGNGEPSNEVMKDEPAMDAEKAERATAIPRPLTSRRLKKGRRKKKTPPPPPTENVTIPAESTGGPSVPMVLPTVATPAFKRVRSKERGDREKGKKRRKVGNVAAPANSSDDRVEVRTGSAAPDPEKQGSHGLEVFGASTLRPSIHVQKGQKSKERALRNKRRKRPVQLPGETTLFQNSSRHALHEPDTRGHGGPENRCECWRYTKAAKRLRPRKPRTRAEEDAELTTMTLTAAPAIVMTTATQTPPPTPPPPRTSPAPYMSPIQISIQRAREQFSRKKRRKAARAPGQQ